MNMFDQAFTTKATKSIPIYIVTAAKLGKMGNNWSESMGFAAKDGQICMMPDAKGNLASIFVGLENHSPWVLSALPEALPKGIYHLETDLKDDKLDTVLLGWALGFYRFSELKQKKPKTLEAKLLLPKGANSAWIKAFTDATTQVRTMINLPADRMTPAAIAKAAVDMADEFDAKCSVIKDQKTLEKDYPLVHAVGKGAENKPCFIDLTWGKKSHPLITLVGKGVSFDTGGLNIKPDSAMRIMKKDMGGAAHALGLARIIMELKLPVRLRVLIPAVENAVSGSAMRPLDVIYSRKGLSVEIGHTDAEGRLILADALYEASTDKPKLIIDFATLTGAARVALGPDLPVLFSNDQKIADKLLKLSGDHGEPFWQLPLHKPYRKWIEGRTADLCNVASSSLSSEISMAGAITAALFLEEFVDPDVSWVHLDLYAWNGGSKPGRPEGGEAMGLRSIIKLLENVIKLTKS